MNVVEKIKNNSLRLVNQVFYQTSDDTMSWKELDVNSDKLAYHIIKKLGNGKSPVIVYGHKNKYMLICFLACVKAEHA